MNFNEMIVPIGDVGPTNDQQLLSQYLTTPNPVTRSVLFDMITRKLDRLAWENKKPFCGEW
jgi:hypothetical protein